MKKYEKEERKMESMLFGNSLVIPEKGVQFSSAAQSCPILCDPMDCRMPGFPVHHQLQELAQALVH